MTEQKFRTQEHPFTGKQTSSMAVVSLVLGIASYVVVPLFGAIAAIITGNLARKEIRQNPETLSGEGLAQWGLILGWVNIGLSVVGMCLAFVIFVMTILMAFGVIAVPFLMVPILNGGY